MKHRLVTLVMIALLAGCSREGPPRPHRSPPPPTSSIPSAGTVRSADRAPRPAPSAIVRQRERDLVIPARQSHSPFIAFSRRRLAVLAKDHLVVWELEDWKLAVKIPVAEPRAVMTMADGAFVVVAGRETLRLEQHETKPTRLPRLMLVPGSQLWPDRRDPLTLWVPLGRTLYRYVLPGPDDPPPDRLVPTATLPLEEHDERVFAGLKDGSFLFTTESGLVKFHPEGKATRGPTPVASRDVWRLLSAHRIDRAWVASQSGSLELIDFVANFGVVRRVQVAETPYDIAADDRHFAVVRAHYEPGQRRRWSVALLDTDGKTVFEHPLPAGPRPETSDWVGRETLNRGVALAPDDSCLAVGGPSWVTVWEIDSGRVLLAAETAQQQLTTNDDESSPTTVAPTGSAPTSRHRESGGWERDRARTTGR